MIRPSDRKKIIEVLGKHYTPSVMAYLEREGIVNTDGKPFSGARIRGIVNGLREHEELELAIARHLAAERERKKKLIKEQIRLFG